jgi:hypothetical protein
MNLVKEDFDKRLRYYLDFCHKYPVPSDRAKRVRLFCEKLKDKKQTEDQRDRAAHAVSLYFTMPENRIADPPGEEAGSGGMLSSVGRAASSPSAETPAQPNSMPSDDSYYISEDAPLYSTYATRRSQYTDAGYQEKSDSHEWDKVLDTTRRSRCGAIPARL